MGEIAPITKTNIQFELGNLYTAQINRRRDEPPGVVFEDAESVLSLVTTTPAFLESVYRPALAVLQDPNQRIADEHLLILMGILMWREACQQLIDRQQPDNRVSIPTADTLGFFSRLTGATIRYDQLGPSGLVRCSDPHGMVVEQFPNDDNEQSSSLYFIRQLYKYRLSMKYPEQLHSTYSLVETNSRFPWALRYAGLGYVIPNSQDTIAVLKALGHLVSEYQTLPFDKDQLKTFARSTYQSFRPDSNSPSLAEAYSDHRNSRSIFPQSLPA